MSHYLTEKNFSRIGLPCGIIISGEDSSVAVRNIVSFNVGACKTITSTFSEMRWVLNSIFDKDSTKHLGAKINYVFIRNVVLLWFSLQHKTWTTPSIVAIYFTSEIEIKNFNVHHCELTSSSGFIGRQWLKIT